MRLPLILLCLTATPLAAQTYPVQGSWSCEVADFTFTADTYQPGDGTMSWLLGGSGDSFPCTPLH